MIDQLGSGGHPSAKLQSQDTATCQNKPEPSGPMKQNSHTNPSMQTLPQKELQRDRTVDGNLLRHHALALLPPLKGSSATRSTLAKPNSNLDQTAQD